MCDRYCKAECVRMCAACVLPVSHMQKPRIMLGNLWEAAPAHQWR
jgi:hypothetical protein